MEWSFAVALAVRYLLVTSWTMLRKPRLGWC